MTQEQGQEILKQNGYGYGMYWHDAPRTINPEHTHPEDVAIVVLSGTIDVVTYSITDSYAEGGFYELKANIPHHSTVGEDGCEYLVAKKLSSSSGENGSGVGQASGKDGFAQKPSGQAEVDLSEK